MAGREEGGGGGSAEGCKRESNICRTITLPWRHSYKRACNRMIIPVRLAFERL